MTSEQEENLVKSILKGYKYCNEPFLHDIQAISTNIEEEINSPYGYLRNFSVNACCMLYSGFYYDIHKICSYKYPVFQIDDNNTFTIHYDNARNKPPKYVIDLSRNKKNDKNLFSNNTNATKKQHYIIKYYGSNKLETLNMYKIVVENNNTSLIHIQNFVINNDIMFEKENEIKNPQFNIKENEQIEENIKLLKCC